MTKTMAMFLIFGFPAQVLAHGGPDFHQHPHGAFALPGFEAMAVLALIGLAGLAFGNLQSRRMRRRP